MMSRTRRGSGLVSGVLRARCPENSCFTASARVCGYGNAQARPTAEEVL